MFRLTRTLPVCLVLASLAGSALGDPIADIEKKLTEAQKKLQSLTAKIARTRGCFRAEHEDIVVITLRVMKSTRKASGGLRSA